MIRSGLFVCLMLAGSRQQNSRKCCPFATVREFLVFPEDRCSVRSLKDSERLSIGAGADRKSFGMHIVYLELNVLFRPLWWPNLAEFFYFHVC